MVVDMSNKIDLPEVTHISIGVQGLAELIADLAELGVNGVTVRAVDVAEEETGFDHRFLVDLRPDQLVSLINQRYA
jgi:hypothetical protein